MADYRNWAEKEVAVTSLLLDPLNPRIPPGPQPLEQRALIAELLEHDSVYELAKDIAENGYFPLESLIGWVGNDKKTYVLEGNRRLAALKLLHSPESAPEASVKKFRTLVSKIRTPLPSKVRVLFAPDRPAAAPVLMKKHTKSQIKGWSPVMQAHFYRTLAASGLSPAELAAEYGSTPSEIAEFLRTDAIYELACKVPLPDKLRDVVHDPRKFKQLSTLQRIVDTPKARAALGIEFDDDGRVVGTVKPEEFTRGFTRILTDVVSGTENTRTLNDAQGVERYLADIKADLPDKKQKGSFTGDTYNPGGAVAKKPSPAAMPKKSAPAARTPRKSASVVPAGTKCTVKNTHIREVFEELRTLKIEKNPNASAVLFRIVLELSVGHYLEKSGKMKFVEDYAKKKGKDPDWCPSLRQMLKAILNDPEIELSRQARKKLTSFTTLETSSLSVDTLDSYVHNQFSPPTERELRSYWEALEDLFALTLHEPPRPAKKPAE